MRTTRAAIAAALAVAAMLSGCVCAKVNDAAKRHKANLEVLHKHTVAANALDAPKVDRLKAATIATAEEIERLSRE